MSAVSATNIKYGCVCAQTLAAFPMTDDRLGIVQNVLEWKIPIFFVVQIMVRFATSKSKTNEPYL